MISKRVLIIAAGLLLVAATGAMAAQAVSAYVDVTTLNIPDLTGTDRLDMSGLAGPPRPGGDAIIHSGGTGGTPYATVNGYILDAYDAGAWDKAGIMSSYAFADTKYGVGIMTGAEYNAANGGDFMKTFPVSGGGTIVKYPAGTILATDTVLMSTYRGDFDFNGAVDSVDLAKVKNTVIALNHAPGSVPQNWVNGDTDYNATVDSIDLAYVKNLIISQNHTGNLPTIVVPEPSAIVLVLMGIAGLLGFRKFAK